MQSKEKRKINPRRRLLMRLIVVIVAIAILLVLGLRALKPKGAQIVYIAPDENGYDAIWLADLNDPENPRQLTFHERVSIGYFQVSSENSIILYSIGNPSIPMELWLLNLDTNEHTNLTLCETNNCVNFQLNYNGQWLVFDDHWVNEIYAYDLRTFEKHLILEFEERLTYSHLSRWVGSTDRIVFLLSQSNNYDEFAFYSVEELSIVDTIILETSAYSPNFSDTGNSYIYYPYYSEYVTRQLRNVNNPDRTLDLPYVVYDWHPNDEILLMVDNSYNDRIFNMDIYLFDMLTGDYEILLNTENNFPRLSFNADWTQLLYSSYTPNAYLDQFMLFDMETREEITLPFVGRDPQWVNGGR